MIEIKDKIQCSGCSACYNSCPVNAISMRVDSEGFAYPIVNSKICIQCNKCERSCPYVTKQEKRTDLKLCFAAYNKSPDDREKSSSGGMFVALAKASLDQGGIVFGASYDKIFLVHHTSAENEEELLPLIGSKYLQSRIGDIYKSVLKQLKTGRNVLFVGTGCQIGGLLGFLGRDYENLICVDFICLGTPSPKVWTDYLETFFSDKNIRHVNFKDKTLGWHTFSLRIEGDKCSSVKNGRHTYFFSGYFKHLYSRPSCSSCIFKVGNRLSDITISDCWGYGVIAPELDDNRGLSSIVCHSEKGLMLFQSIQKQLVWKEAKFEDILKYNNNYCTPAPMGKKRRKFWEDYERIPKEKLFKKYCKPESEKAYANYIRKIRSKLKKVLQKGKV